MITKRHEWYGPFSLSETITYNMDKTEIGFTDKGDFGSLIYLNISIKEQHIRFLRDSVAPPLLLGPQPIHG